MERHRLEAAARVEPTLDWLREHGYLGGLIVNDFAPGYGGFLLLGRPGEPMVGARSGDTLVWDGESVTVELREG